MSYRFVFPTWVVDVYYYTDRSFLTLNDGMIGHTMQVATKLFKELGLQRGEHPFIGGGTMPENDYCREQFDTLVRAYENKCFVRLILSKEELARVEALNSL